MVSCKVMLMAFVFGCMPSAVSTKSIRGFESNASRKLASSGAKCWSWCYHGHCSWNWGCQCICKDNYEGACCSDMMVCGPQKHACPQDMLTPKTVEISSLLDSNGKFR